MARVRVRGGTASGPGTQGVCGLAASAADESEEISKARLRLAQRTMAFFAAAPLGSKGSGRPLLAFCAPLLLQPATSCTRLQSRRLLCQSPVPRHNNTTTTSTTTTTPPLTGPPSLSRPPAPDTPARPPTPASAHISLNHRRLCRRGCPFFLASAFQHAPHNTRRNPRAAPRPPTRPAHHLPPTSPRYLTIAHPHVGFERAHHICGGSLDARHHRPARLRHLTRT